MTMNYDTADKMANISTEKRQKMDKAGAFSSGRSAALLGKSDEGKEQEQPPPTRKGNIVEAEMKDQEALKQDAAIFDKASNACYAAREACQKEQEGVESKKERDAIRTKCLNDLIAVIEGIRDSGADIMSEIAPAQDASEPLKL